jgi:hypothetical protein
MWLTVATLPLLLIIGTSHESKAPERRSAAEAFE